jgi:hypothetical protein
MGSPGGVPLVWNIEGGLLGVFHGVGLLVGRLEGPLRRESPGGFFGGYPLKDVSGGIAAGGSLEGSFAGVSCKWSAGHCPLEGVYWWGCIRVCPLECPSSWVQVLSLRKGLTK